VTYCDVSNEVTPARAWRVGGFVEPEGCPHLSYIITWCTIFLKFSRYLSVFVTQISIAMVGFKYNNLVRLQGLINAAYNGKVAVIISISADENAGRYRVELLLLGEVACSLSGQQILVKPENMARACDCCYLAGASTMQYCGRCKNAAYCNADCQRSDWTRHKVYCSRMNSQRQLIKCPLHLAASLGNLTEVQNLIREGADVNKATKEDGATPLHIAAEKGQLSMVQYLVLQGADVDKATSHGGTPLYLAAFKGFLAVIQCLIQQGADMNKATNDGATPLLMAAQEDHLAVVQYLVQQGADKDKTDNKGCTPLFMAAGKSHLSVVQYLIQQGANINQAADGSITPLAFAIDQGNITVAIYLRGQGAI
jgi:hypothetical protein